MAEGHIAFALRPATRADGDFCFELHRAAMRDYVAPVWGWVDADQRAYLDRTFDPSLVQIITVDGKDAGLLQVERRESDVYLTRIEIHPLHQGRRIGSRIIRTLQDEAAADHRPVVLGVLVTNPRARALYERLGFREIGRPSPHKIEMRWDA